MTMSNGFLNGVLPAAQWYNASIPRRRYQAGTRASCWLR